MSTSISYPLIHDANSRSVSQNSDYTVFIVDDDSSSRMFLESYLKKMPNIKNGKKPKLAIHSFKSGEACLEAMPLAPDIIVLDFYLSDDSGSAMDGLSVLKKIKKKRPSCKVIAMSGQQNVMITAELFNQGASDYISKEHAAIERTTQSVIRLISELEVERKKRTRTFVFSVVLFLLGILVGAMY